MSQLRVVQWATGNIGSRSLRHVIEHPALDLAGVYVTSPAKAGRDAADLCGLDVKTGVTATGDIGEILDLGADCVLYMPAACDFDEVTRLLASGANIVTTRGEFHHPASMEPAARARVEADPPATPPTAPSTPSPTWSPPPPASAPPPTCPRSSPPSADIERLCTCYGTHTVDSRPCPDPEGYRLSW